ncbi:unnamed protein product [Oikopleura dioica]|uniref:Uncharacterized protein n=1 Tax=Oikopleura dioica TaxID=34765 RepID=E4Z4C0_OIKDI|nr:unnamed protein product [Oikopleura dioica]
MYLSLRQVAMATETDPKCSGLFKFLLNDEDTTLTEESRRKKFRDWRGKPQNRDKLAKFILSNLEMLFDQGQKRRSCSSTTSFYQEDSDEQNENVPPTKVRLSTEIDGLTVNAICTPSSSLVESDTCRITRALSKAQEEIAKLSLNSKGTNTEVTAIKSCRNLFNLEKPGEESKREFNDPRGSSSCTYPID